MFKALLKALFKIETLADTEETEETEARRMAETLANVKREEEQKRAIERAQAATAALPSLADVQPCVKCGNDVWSMQYRALDWSTYCMVRNEAMILTCTKCGNTTRAKPNDFKVSDDCGKEMSK